MRRIVFATLLLLGLVGFTAATGTDGRVDVEEVSHPAMEPGLGDPASLGHLAADALVVRRLPPPRWQNRSFQVPATNHVSSVYQGDTSLEESLAEGLAEPTALASGDLDEDGVPDLVCGYSGSNGDLVTLHLGNVDAIYPNSPAAQRRRLEGAFTDEPFLEQARISPAPVKPDFMASGDFDNDGHLDVALASRHGTAVHLLLGDGRGGLASAEPIDLDGAVTAMVAGEINRADGLVDLVVAIDRAGAPALLVFEGPEGALRAEPESVSLPAVPTAMLLARTTEGPWRDLALAAGDELLILRGRDRRLVLDEAQRAEVGPPVVERIGMPSAIEALAWGDFVWQPTPEREMALLLVDGAVLLINREGDNADSSWKTIGRRDLLVPTRNDVSSASALALLLPVRLSGAPTEDLAIIDATGRRLWVLAGMEREDLTAEASLSNPGVVASLDLEQSPVAVLPMRLNRDALTDLVLLQPGARVPVVAATASRATITVDIDTDSATAGDNECSLREAINNANSDSDTTSGDCAAGAGTDLIAFAIGGGGLTATIALGSELPAITDPVTIDGTTQACASPPCVALDGRIAGFVVAGLQVTGGSSTVRGLAIHRFTGDPLDDNVNGFGVYLPSSWNVVEGNFIGTDLTGTVDLDNDGIDVLVHDGSSNTIGGTTAAARNVVSGGNGGGAGVYIYSDAAISEDNVVLGNYVGTDVTGTVDLGNSNSGVIVIGLNSIVGGTGIGAPNVISGNSGNGIWMPFPNQGSLVLGNYIGTDVTGTVAIGNGATYPAIWMSGANNNIGGTAVGARNVISGNPSTGVFIRYATAQGNQVLGNYIGTDVNGTADLGNGSRGVDVYDAGPNNTVGGATAGARNVISGNESIGVRIYGASLATHVLGNFIGTDVNGTAALGNGATGVHVNGASFNFVGGTSPGAGNLVSGNAGNGINLNSTAQSNQVLGNYVGTDVNGTAAIPNGLNYPAVWVAGANNTIGGTTAGARNLISGNQSNGVHIAPGAQNNQVLGNYIGSDVNGTAALGNTGVGVRIDGALNNFLGGSSPGAGNVISGNDLHQVLISGTSTDNHVTTRWEVSTRGRATSSRAMPGTVWCFSTPPKATRFSATTSAPTSQERSPSATG
jgi:CSLREA domain-containing protein